MLSRTNTEQTVYFYFGNEATLLAGAPLLAVVRGTVGTDSGLAFPC